KRMEHLPRTPRTTLKRLPKRGSHEREVIDRILDEGFICHVGFVVDAQPIVIPTGYARIADNLIIHGSQASRMLRALGQGIGAGTIGISSFDELSIGNGLRSGESHR